MITTELLPCPFCAGKELEIFFESNEDGKPFTYYVYCKTCGCHGRDNYPIGWLQSEQEAIEGWNHRGAIRPCDNSVDEKFNIAKRQMIDALKKKIAQVELLEIE